MFPHVNRIDSFTGEYRFLSNFFPAPIIHKGKLWQTTEHAYQALKFTSEELQEKIRTCETAGKTKTTARKLLKKEMSRVEEERNIVTNWDEKKLMVMKVLLLKKFQIPALEEALHATGDADLIEGNTWGDVYWGVCKGEGQNMLGKLLMGIRAHQFDYQRKLAQSSSYSVLFDLPYFGLEGEVKENDIAIR